MLQNNMFNVSSYETAFNELNPIQRSATLWDKGSLLLLAGPGSGKTKVLTTRITRLIIESPDKKFRILALTFTNKAADEMHSRVASMVADVDNRLFIGTYHSFCAKVLRQHGSHIGIKANFTITTNTNDRLEVLRDALKKNNIENELIPTKDLLGYIDNLKSKFIEPDDCKNNILNPYKKEIIYNAYKAYEDELKSLSILDFNSIIYYTCKLFKKYPVMAKQYQTIYTYWCIDEFQDTNYAQYQLLKLMSTPDFKNLFVVADEDQLIYQWNGASHKRIDEFKNDFKPKVMQMPTNYRCPAEIVDLANNLIEFNQLRQADKKPNIAAKKLNDNTSKVIRLLKFSSEKDEASSIACDIIQNYNHQLSQVLVLARNRKLLEYLLTELNRNEIDAVISQRRDVFISTPFIFLYNVLKLANNRHNLKSFQKFYQAFIDFYQSVMDINYDEINEKVKLQGTDYLSEWADSVFNKISDKNFKDLILQIKIKLIQANDYKGFLKESLLLLDKIVQGLLNTNKVSSTPINEDITQVSEALSKYQEQNQSEFQAYYLEDKDAWNAIYREISNKAGSNLTLENFLHELDLQSKEPPIKPNCVTLMTIHGAKGKEFDHVYIIGMAEGILPSFQSKKFGDNSPELEEERRNCYVALTRAKQTLTLSYSENYYNWPKNPSQFLTEMGLDLS